jgi:hypothetical protein
MSSDIEGWLSGDGARRVDEAVQLRSGWVYDARWS